MTPRIILLVLVLAVPLALSACGSSAPKSAAVQTTTISLGSPSPAASAPAASRAKSDPATAKTNTASSGARAAAAAVKTAAKPSKPTPSSCLRFAGLLNPHEVSKGEMAALSGAVGEDVFVEGPYKTRAAAASAAASLYGVETAASGGKYSVSAALSAHLGPKVKAVAACLRGAKARGFLTF